MTTLTEAQWDALQDACDQLEYADLRDDYSGRGMYGKRCIGITCSKPLDTAIKLAWALAQDDINTDALKVFELLAEASANTDSMGIDAILYWPSIQANVVTETVD